MATKEARPPILTEPFKTQATGHVNGSLKDYKSRLAGISPTKFIGSILWYSVAGTVERGIDGKRVSVPVRVHQDVLEEWFDELGIDLGFLPPRIKKIDAFRNASSSVRMEYEVPGSDGSRFATLRIEEVKSDQEQVIRHVVRVVRDARKEQLSLDHMATIKFFRGGRTAKGKRHSGDHYKPQILSRVRGDERIRVAALIKEFETRYDDLSSHLHPPALRAVVRAILTSYNAIPMKSSGGLYFVHKSRWTQLQALQALMAKLGAGCELEEMPLIDTVDKRTMLTEALEEKVVDDCNKLLVQIASVNEACKGGKVPGRKYAEVNASYTEIAAALEDYADLIGIAQGKATRALELALDSVMEMAGRLDSTSSR